MLFFFEMFLFVLVMLTLALGEFVSRWLALILWLVITALTLVGYLLVRRSLRGIIASGDAVPMLDTEAAAAGDAGVPDVVDPSLPAAAPGAVDPSLPAAAGSVGAAPGDVLPTADPQRPADTPTAARVSPEGFTATPREVTPLDAKWARTLLYNWRRTNVLLVLGALVVSGWYWLGR